MSQAKQHSAECRTVAEGLLGHYELDDELGYHKLAACIPLHHCLVASSTVSTTLVNCP